jgi:hypothetical protein
MPLGCARERHQPVELEAAVGDLERYFLDRNEQLDRGFAWISPNE